MGSSTEETTKTRISNKSPSAVNKETKYDNITRNKQANRNRNKNKNNNNKKKRNRKELSTQATKNRLKQGNIRCMYTNADTLLNKMNELKDRIAEQDPTIIAVTEVLPKNGGESILKTEYSLKGYDMFVTPNIENRNEKSGTNRGIIIYVKSSIKANKCEVKQSKKFESLMLTIQTYRNDKILIACLYRTDSIDNTEDICEMIRKISRKKYTHYLVMGDFNYPEIEWENWTTASPNIESNENKFIEALRDAFLHQHITEPTRGRATCTPHVLDLILTNEEGMASEITQDSPLGKSDHAVINFNFNVYIDRKPRMKLKRYYERADYEGMKNDLKKIKWNEILKGNMSVQEMWDEFDSIVKKAVDDHVPKKMVSSQMKRAAVPVDEVFINARRKKHSLWRKYIRNKTDEAWQAYTKARNKIKSLLSKLRRQFEKNIALNVKENPKAAWAYIKSKYKAKEGIQNLATDQNDPNSPLTKTDQENANILSEYFSSVFVREPPGAVPNLDKKTENDIPALIITEKMVMKKLMKLKTNKSPGIDEMHPKMLKELKSEICKPLTIIFNKSLESNKLPLIWKQAKISAIYKNKGSKRLACNYRPVSLTSIVCKMMEAIIRDHIIEHMKKELLFSKRQYGFINGRSTSIQLLKILEVWTAALEEGFDIDVIFMDFRKAFDKVPHRRLGSKLKSYGIQGPVLRWIENFLNGRTQKVVVNGAESEWRDVLSGIPQGSVLGPLLFVIYINDMPDTVPSPTYLFADDTKMYRVIRNEMETCHLQTDINTLQSWSRLWLLEFHEDKCKHMHIGTHTTGPHRYTMTNGDENVMLETLYCERDLGIHVDYELKFDKHIQKIVNKANAMVGLIRRTYKFLDHQNFTLLYKALVRSHMDYATSVWSPHKVKYILQLEGVQRRATKMLPGMRDLTYPERLKMLKLPTLAYRRARIDMIETFKIAKGIYDNDVAPALPYANTNTNISIVTRGHQYKLFKTRFYKDIGKFSFLNRIIQNWNKLPEKVVMAKTTNSFKNRLDKAWRNQEILYNFEAKFNPRENINIDNLSSISHEQAEADGLGEEDSEEEPTPALRHSVVSLNEGGVPSGRLGPSGS